MEEQKTSTKLIERLVYKATSAKFVIAIMIMATTCYLAIKGVITSAEFTPLATMVVGFYFGQSVAKNSTSK